MGTHFETSEEHASAHLRPLRVAMRVDAVYAEARDLVHDLPGWSVQRADEAAHTLVCTPRKRLFSGSSTVTIRCTGVAGVPSAVVHVRSESTGGWIARDRANVLEFLVPFARRVC